MNSVSRTVLSKETSILGLVATTATSISFRYPRNWYLLEMDNSQEQQIPETPVSITNR
jgi:hypothetical protein